jgi:hypothetical protein
MVSTPGPIIAFVCPSFNVRVVGIYLRILSIALASCYCAAAQAVEIGSNRSAGAPGKGIPISLIPAFLEWLWIEKLERAIGVYGAQLQVDKNLLNILFNRANPVFRSVSKKGLEIWAKRLPKSGFLCKRPLRGPSESFRNVVASPMIPVGSISPPLLFSGT